MELNDRLQPLNSLPAKENDKLPPWKFGVHQKIQQRTILGSKLVLKSFVVLSNISTGAGGFASGSSLFLTTTLTPSVPQQNYPNFAVPYISLYQGTAQDPNFEIYPAVGGSVTVGNYSVQGGLDYQNYNGTNSVWKGVITNNSGGSQNLYLVTQWKYIQYTNGTVT